MENNFDNNFTNDIKPIGRPQLLTVNCILTWVCCGILFISALMSLIPKSPEKEQQQIEQIRAMNPEAADKMEAALADQSGGKKVITSLISILAIGLSAFGAAQMWKLKKQGFYIYLVGELLPYIGLAIGGTQAISAVGSLAGGLGNAIVGITIAVMLVFDAVFIIMYAVNLKYMNGDNAQNVVS